MGCPPTPLQVTESAPEWAKESRFLIWKVCSQRVRSQVQGEGKRQGWVGKAVTEAGRGSRGLVSS